MNKKEQQECENMRTKEVVKHSDKRKHIGV